jgi:hypothetical protein
VVAPFVFDRTFTFPATGDELWSVVSDIRRFPEWWGWLRTFEVDSPASSQGHVPEGQLTEGQLTEGTVAECVIRPPLPYAVRVVITVTRVVPGRVVEASVSGDLEGPARLEVEGPTARLAWELDVRRPLLRRAARLARPALVWGHEWVIANGVEAMSAKGFRKVPPAGSQGHGLPDDGSDQPANPVAGSVGAARDGAIRPGRTGRSGGAGIRQRRLPP